MSTVVKLADYQNNQDRSFIRCLEELLAQALAGEATGAVAIVGYKQGDVRAYVMGSYKSNSTEALSATFRLGKKLAANPHAEGGTQTQQGARRRPAQ